MSRSMAMSKRMSMDMGMSTSMGISWAEVRKDVLRWAVCGAVVVGVHGAVAAAMINWRDADDPAMPAAAMVIELAPFPMAPPESATELPPGPEQVEAEASPSVAAEQVKDVVEEKVESAEAQEVEAEVPDVINPEIVLASLPPKPEPQVQVPQQAQTPAPETTAPQVMPAEISEIAAAPVQGQLTIDNSMSLPTWRNQVVTKLERNKRYPADARGARGIVQVAFSLDRLGHVVSTVIAATSGSPVLDREALDMIRRAQPFPPPPSVLSGLEVRLTVPVRFNMR